MRSIETARRRRFAPVAFVVLAAAALVLQPSFEGTGPAWAGKQDRATACSRRRPCDTTPPVVAIGAPAAGATVAGNVTVAGTASDDAAVAKVEITVDSLTPSLATGTATWTGVIDTTALGDGSHTIAATATDAAGNAGRTVVTVSVANAPAPSPSGSPTPSPEPAPPGTPVTAPSVPQGTIGGFAFQETDRDGIFEEGETALANQHLYLYSASGTYLKSTYSASNGWYQFNGFADGSYEVRVAPDSWWAIRDQWVPDTTGSILPRSGLQLAGSARADFGWRPIVRSTTASEPISSFVGSNGVTIQSYDDVVSASAVYESLMRGSLIGQEAQFVTIRFDYSAAGSTATMAVQTGGTYTSYHATCYIPYISWLDSGDRTLFHEYGHAWSMYYAFMVQQDPSLTAYLNARGLSGDSRVGSSYAWDPKEMIAEDYRQLFGSPNAQTGGQINTEIPPAGSVTGLRDFLQTTFTTSP